MDIILCATQRCGSTLIVEDMRNAEVLGNPEEWFVSWTPDKTHVKWDDALNTVKKRATGQNGASAVKVMANQLAHIDKCLSTIRTIDEDTLFPYFAREFGGAHWIWLKRNDVVAQAISRIMAHQTGINHSTAKVTDVHFAGNLLKGYDPHYNQRAVYRYGAILRQVSAITLENLTWERFFDANRISPITLIYEEVMSDREMKHLDIFAHLLHLSDRPKRVARKMVKMGNEKNELWRDRFYSDAVKNNFLPAKADPLIR